MTPGGERAGRPDGPAGNTPPGHPARARNFGRRPLAFAALAATALGAASAVVVNLTPTSALMTSRAEPQVNTIHAGSWYPPVPAECGNVTDYKGGILYGTPGNDTIYAGNKGEIIFGLDGDDTIYGGNAKDCLIGGPGDDTLVSGNGKDILIGGRGNDHLVGGNGLDVLDGGGDPGDVCIGVSGPATYTGCATRSTAAVVGDPVVATPATQPSSAPVPSASASSSAPSVAPPSSGSSTPTETPSTAGGQL